MSSNLALPNDIILQIFESGSTDARSLIACLQVCHQLHDIISQSDTLTYKIKLFALGMCDNFQDDFDILHRSSMLTAYDEALRELKWTRYETIDLQNMEDPYVSDGLLVFQVVGDSVPRTETRLVVFQLPSALRGVQARRWYLNFDFSSNGFISDAGLDLLVIFCSNPHHVQEPGFHLHLCSLSTGDKHPLSQTGGIIRLSLNREFQWWDWGDFAESSRIQGDYVAYLMDSGRSLLLWNWRSGALLDMPLPQPSIAFSFLGDRRLVMVYGTFTTAGWRFGRLHVYSLEKSAQNPGDVFTPCLEAIYRLPDDKVLGDWSNEVRLCSSHCRSIPAGHFYRNAEDTETLVLSTTVPRTSHHSNLIIPARALQTPARHGGGHRPASESSTRNNTPDSALEVPWSDWGRVITSVPFFGPSQWNLSGRYRLPFASGARTVMHEMHEPLTPQNQGVARPSSFSPAMDTADQMKTLVVTDYHPGRVAFAIARGDPHIRHGQPLSVGADAPHTSAYLRVQATLPAQSKRFCPVMCGDAVLLFEYTVNVRSQLYWEKLHVFTF